MAPTVTLTPTLILLIVVVTSPPSVTGILKLEPHPGGGISVINLLPRGKTVFFCFRYYILHMYCVCTSSYPTRHTPYLVTTYDIFQA